MFKVNVIWVFHQKYKSPSCCDERRRGMKENRKQKMYPTVEHNKWCILILKCPQHDTEKKRQQQKNREKESWTKLYEKLKSIK